MSDCGCYRDSLLDPMGNVIRLYTCRACLDAALRFLRDYTSHRESGVVQLVLSEDREGRLSDAGAETIDLSWGQPPLEASDEVPE